MKKAKLLLLTLLSVLGMNTAWAETVSPYEVDFNTAILTTNHDFAVASNWRHIVGSYKDSWDDTYYMSYSYKDNEGLNESGTLLAYRQYASDPTSSGSGSTVYDLLVSPVVSGEVTMYVKPSISASSSIPAFVEIYNVDEAGSTRGSLIQKFTEDNGFVADDANEGWYTITLSLSAAQRIGIRAQHVYMDNFSATSAEIVAEKKLTIKTVADVDGASTTYFNQQEDGTILARYLVTLINSGDVDLAPGDDNYTLSLFNRSVPATTYGAFAIPVALAAGETSEPFEMQVSLPANQAGWKYWDVKENISGTTKEGKWCGTNLYESKFIFDKAGTSYTNSSSATTKPIDFGKVNEATTLNYEIYNPGSAPLTINSFTIDAPFTSTAPTGEFTVAAKEKKAIDITFPATEPGIFNGKVTINYTNYGKEQATYTLDVSATVIDPSKNLITFSNADNTNGQFPAGSIHPDEVYIYKETVDDVTNYFLTYAFNSSTIKKFITPMLTATAGEIFSFDAWASGSQNPTLTVYTSKDRMNWTELTKLSGNALDSKAKNYTVTIEEAGDYYLAFEMTNGTKIDNIYGLTLKDLPEHDWYVMDWNLPTTGKQNNPYTATISVKNINAEADAIATATLYVGGEAVAVVENVALEGNDKTTAEGILRTPSMSNVENPVEITFTYNPHTTGELAAYIELKTGDNVLLTEEVTVNIAEEVAYSELTIGNDVGHKNSAVPFYTTWMDDETGSMCDFYYSKEQLTTFELKEGDVINAITFRGLPTANKDITSLTAEAWIELIDPSTFTAGNVNKEAMTHITVFNEEAVSLKSTKEIEFKLDLSESPITWDGESAIRIYTNIDGHKQYQNINFPIDDTSGYIAYYAHGASPSSWSSTYSPVAYLSLAMEEKTLSGTVTDEVTGEPIEGATVTIRNEENDVEYTATTDAEGKYTINVVQDLLTYTATVEAEGYVTEEDDEVLSFEEGSLEYDFTLYPENPVYPTVTVTISDSEYATLYYEDEYLGIPDGVKAYTAKVDGKNIVLTEVSDFIPAGKPVIINGPQGEYEFEVLPMSAPVAGGMFAELIVVDENETYNNGSVLGGECVEVKLGNDRANSPYNVNTTSLKSYCQGIFGETSIAYLVGANNPKDGELDGNDKSSGNGFKPDNKNLPQSGCYYMITPTMDGHFTAFVVVNANKNLYVTKSDGTCLPVNSLTLKKDGDEPTTITIGEDYLVAEKVNGTLEFDVEEGETYYLFCTGSKLGFGGYLFVSSDDNDDPNNDLTGTEEDLTITDDAANKYYVLSWKDANKNPEELGFYFWSGSNDGHSMQLGAHKAYIMRPADAANNKGYMFWLPDAIEGVTMNALTDADAIYTLSGIRVNANNLKKGIYIVNGKKVVIK